ncbi:MAG: FG-GAP-like repeat-containing protein, partial [Phycisphaerae bacterium]|nr:FG-GAP-like repeat-containing protein [Phycisphaerae bacterium]
MHARTLGRLMFGVAACTLVACDNAQPPAPQPPSPPPASAGVLTAEQLTAFNRGAGLMGTFAFAEAEAEFAELARELARGLGTAHPVYLDVRLDQGLAMLNQTTDGAQERALAVFDEVLQARPDDVRAQYAAGLGELFLGEPEQALPRFRAAADADPTDPYAAYYVGQCLEFANQFETALDWYQRAIALDPYLRSPLLGLQRTLGRIGRKAEAEAALASFQKLADNPRSRLAEFKYTRMGSKSEVVVPTIARTAAPPRTGELFEEVSIEVEGTPDWRSDGDAPNLTVVDIDHDGRLDLFAANAMRAGTNGVFIATGEHSFRLVAAHPLAGIALVRCALWGDFDNDGLVDVYLCRNGANMLWRQAPRGVWSDVTESTGTAGGEHDTIDGAFADLDHDGDLDLYLVNADGANELLTNNLDGTFRAIGTASGAVGNGKPMRHVLITDIDDDRDADILLVHADDSVEVLLNDRLWRYTPLVHPLANALELTSVVAADLDATGATTLIGLARDTALVLAHADGDRWTVARPAPLPVGADSDRAIAVIDITGDGEPSVIARTPKGFAIFTRRGRPVTEVPAPAKGTVVRAWALMTRTLRGPSIVCVTDEGVAMLDPGAARGAFATLEFSGRTDPSLSMRSNTSGIGTSAAARVGGTWVAFDTFRSTSVAGQSLQPIAVGLGDAPQVDYVSIDWSDGVFQSELGLAAAARHNIVETQRQISSCPVIFAWDGDGFRFITDCLGVGGLGYLVGMTRDADGRGYAGEYAPPRPWERVLLPRDLAIAPRDGVYEFRLGEPMEEACYLDAARLVQYELPPG